MDVNSKQIAGAHYRAPVQHWDFVISNGLDYLRGQASKYITRARKKNGRQDFLKAQHYVEKLMTEEAASMLATWPRMGGVPLDEFVRVNGLNPTEHQMMLFLCYRPSSSARAVQVSWMQDLHELLQRAADSYPIHWLEADGPPPMDKAVAGQHIADDTAALARSEPAGYGYVDQDG